MSHTLSGSNHNLNFYFFQLPTWPTLCVCTQQSSQRLFSHSMRIIQCVSASVCQTLPFSLWVVQHCVSLGYPPQDSNNTHLCGSRATFLFLWRFFLHSLLTTYWILCCCSLSGISLLAWYDQNVSLILDITSSLRRTWFTPLSFLSYTNKSNLTRLCTNAGGPTTDRYTGLWFALLPTIFSVIFFSRLQLISCGETDSSNVTLHLLIWLFVDTVFSTNRVGWVKWKEEITRNIDI